MKLAFIVDRVYPFYTGGYEYLIHDVAEGLSKTNDITIFTAMEKSHENINGVHYFKISNNYRFTNKKGDHNIRDSIRFIVHLLLNVKRFNDYDVVIVNSIPYLLYGYLLKKIRAKKITMFHEAWYDYLKKKNIFFRFFLYHEIKGIVNNSNAVLAVSSATKRSLLENYKARLVYHIPNGIHIKEVKMQCNKLYNIAYLGRLAKIKHVDVLLKAVIGLRSRFPEIRVAIAGDGEEKNKLVNLAIDLEINDIVSFLGRISDREKLNVLSCSEIFVMPSEREGFSIATLEAMAYGCVPVVAKPDYDEVFGTSDFVVENETGLYFKLLDHDDLCMKLIQLMSNHSIYKRIRESAMKKAKDYEWSKIIEKYNDMLREIGLAP